MCVWVFSLSLSVVVGTVTVIVQTIVPELPTYSPFRCGLKDGAPFEFLEIYTFYKCSVVLFFYIKLRSGNETILVSIW